MVLSLRPHGQSRVNPIALALLRSGLQGGPVQTNTQGLGRLAQALSGAFIQAQSDSRDREREQGDARDLSKALQTFSQGVRPFTDPDTGVVQERTGQAAGSAGALTAGLQSVDNPRIMSALAPSLIELASKPPTEKFEAVLDAEGNPIAQRSSLSGQVIADPRAPKPPVPGRDTPFSPEVHDQLVAIAGAEKAAEIQALLASQGRGESLERELTPGERAIDEAFAKEFVEFNAQGGFADAEKNIAQLSEVQKRLESGENLTGGLLDFLPTTLRAPFDPESVAVQEQVEEVVQRNLRLVLGAQFTEEEGKRLIARAFNPQLEEPENAKRLGRLIGAMSGALEAKQAASAYFNKHGTLRGFEGQTSFRPGMFDSVLDELDKELKGVSAPQTRETGRDITKIPLEEIELEKLTPEERRALDARLRKEGF